MTAISTAPGVANKVHILDGEGRPIPCTCGASNRVAVTLFLERKRAAGVNEDWDWWKSRGYHTLPYKAGGEVQQAKRHYDNGHRYSRRNE